MILNTIGITVYQFMIDDKTIYEQDYIANIDAYVFTLEEWFEKNKVTINKK